MTKSEQQKQKKGKTQKGVTLIVLIIAIVAILFVAVCFYAIIHEVVDSIQDTIVAIMNSIRTFLSNPGKWAGAQWGKLSNWVNESLISWQKYNIPIGEFNAKAYEDLRIDPTVVISIDEFNKMKNSLDNGINRNIAGLDNLMLKKMMLAYYRGLYLDDTTILIELYPEDFNLTTEEFGNIKDIDTIIQLYAELEVLENELEEINKKIEELKNQYGNPGFAALLQSLLEKINPEKLIKEMQVSNKKNEIAKYKLTFEQCNTIKEQLAPFSIVEGNELKGIGENGKTYWKTKGMVEIYAGEGEEKIVYYQEGVLDLIYQNHYVEILKINTQNAINYANSVLAYLNKCYTYTENGIKMYSTREYVTREKTIEYVEESNDYNTYKETNKEKEGNIIDWFFNIFSKDDNNAKTEGVVRQLTPTTIEPVEAQYLEFSTKVAQYATPMEFMIEMLEITASKDFINDFIEMVGEETYIKLKLYDIENQEVQNTIEEKERTTTVSGERIEGYTAQVVRKKNVGFLGGALSKWEDVSANDFKEAVGGSILDGNTYCVYATIIASDGQTLQKDYKYEVKLYYNGEEIDSKEFEVNVDISSTSIRFDEGIEPDVTSKYATNKVIETTTVTTFTNKYDLAIKEVKTWYGTFTPTNVEDKTIIIKNLQEVKQSQLTKPGNTQGIHDGGIEVEEYKVIDEIPNAQELNALELMKKLEDADNKVTAVTYSWPKTQTIEKAGNEKVFENKDLEDVIWKEYDENKAEDTDGDDDFFGGYSENYCLNVLYNYVTQRGEGEGENSNYKYNVMTYVDNKRKKVSVKLTYSETLKEGLEGGAVKVQTDYRPFLALLVEYNDLYGGKANIGNLLVNGADMLYDLLAAYPSTEGLVQVLKAALHQYVNNNYTVENFEFDIFDKNNFVRVE